MKLALMFFALVCIKDLVAHYGEGQWLHAYKFFLQYISVQFVGASELGMPVFQALVESSGGYVIPHDSFTTPHLQHNLGFLLEQMYVSKSKALTEGSSLAPTSADSVSQLEGCMVDMRMAG
jgi:hypothetical protein